MRKPDKKNYILNKELIKNIKYLPLAYLDTDADTYKYKTNYHYYDDYDDDENDDETYIYTKRDFSLNDFFSYYEVFGLENIDVEFQKVNKKIQVRLRLNKNLSDDKLNEIIQLNIDKYNKDMASYDKYQVDRLEKIKNKKQNNLEKQIKNLEEQIKKMEK